jgi:hypothetical protein
MHTQVGRDTMVRSLSLRWLPLAALAFTAMIVLSFNSQVSTTDGVVEENEMRQRLQMLYTQINIMTPSDGSGNREPQNANPVTSYMGGYAVPVPAGDNRKAFPYPLPGQERIDPSKYVLRSEADDRFKQMEKRLRLDEKAMETMQKTIKKLKKNTKTKK